VLAVELLLSGGEQEVLTAVHALDRFVFESRHDPLPSLQKPGERRRGDPKQKAPARICRGVFDGALTRGEADDHDQGTIKHGISRNLKKGAQ
jgi:hypothetical protein